jgi:hypothetical protein
MNLTLQIDRMESFLAHAVSLSEPTTVPINRVNGVTARLAQVRVARVGAGVAVI